MTYEKKKIGTLQNLKKVLNVLKHDGVWNANEYLLGSTNALILAVAILEGMEPKFLEYPKMWADEKVITQLEFDFKKAK